MAQFGLQDQKPLRMPTKIHRDNHSDRMMHALEATATFLEKHEKRITKEGSEKKKKKNWIR